MVSGLHDNCITYNKFIVFLLLIPLLRVIDLSIQLKGFQRSNRLLFKYSLKYRIYQKLLEFEIIYPTNRNRQFWKSQLDIQMTSNLSKCLQT